MPFSQQPSYSTYSTEKINLLKVNQSRSTATNRDANIINAFPEGIMNKVTSEQDVWITKRPGFTEYIATMGGTEIRGVYYWRDQNKLYVALDNSIKIYTASSGALVGTLAAAFAGSTGAVGFTEFLYQNGTTKIVVSDGVSVQTIDSANTLVAAAAGFPTPHIPIPIFIDNLLFLAEAATAQIWQSLSNNPLDWTPLLAVNAEIAPDQLRSVCKLNNFIVAFGTSSIEYFYRQFTDAATSDLQRQESATKQVGFVCGLALQDNKAYFVGSIKGGTVDVFRLQDFTMTSLGHDGIRRYLSSYAADYVANIRGSVLQCAGHSWYVLSDGTRTDTYEIGSELWSQWALGATTVFPVKYSFPYAAPDGTRNLFILSTGNAVYNLDANQYQDNSVNFTVTITGAIEDFSTLRWKSMDRLVVNADYPPATATMNISWTDDDYQSYNTPVAVDLFQDLPAIYQLGSFRQRAFKLTYAANQPLRLYDLEVDINKGNT